MPGGGVAFVTVDVRRKRCKSCGEMAEPRDQRLCDHPIVRGGRPGTCDVECCARCAIRIARDRDLCPPHARAAARIADGLAAWDRDA